MFTQQPRLSLWGLQLDLSWRQKTFKKGKNLRKEEWVIAAGSWWGMVVFKENSLNWEKLEETWPDPLQPFLCSSQHQWDVWAFLIPLTSPVLLTEDEVKPVLKAGFVPEEIQPSAGQVVGRLGEIFWEKKTSCILTESKKHWPPVIYSWDELEAK